MPTIPPFRGGIFLHGPSALGFKPSNKEILEVIFGVANVIAIQTEAPLDNPLTFDMGTQTLGEYLLLSQPWGGFMDCPFRATQFKQYQIIGKIVAFKWLYYQCLPGMWSFLKRHLFEALSDSVPTNVLIDDAPMLGKHLTASVPLDGSEMLREERQIADKILPFYQPITADDLRDFAATWQLCPEIVRVVDLRHRQNVIDGVAASIEFFKTAPRVDPPRFSSSEPPDWFVEARRQWV